MNTFRAPFISFPVAFACVALVALVSCKKHESVRDHPLTVSHPQDPQFGVCGLITNDEMTAVIGAPIKDTKASGRVNMGLRETQCYYMAEEASKSVSLTVTDLDPNTKSDRNVEVYWEENFSRFQKKETDKETEEVREKKESLRQQQKSETEEDERRPPDRVAGIGDDAYWSGNRVGGALYVLRKGKNAAYIRISVGGGEEMAIKLEKSKALAVKALGRL